MKENQHVKPIIDIDAGTVTFEVKGHSPLVLHMDKLDTSIVKRAAMVGMAQVRIVDGAAIPAADKAGNIVPEAERLRIKHERMAALIAHYETGTAEWSRAGQGGSGRSITIEAIARVMNIDYASVETYIDLYAARNYEGDRKDALQFLATGQRVMDAIAAIQAERRGPAKLDADDALNELTGG